MLLGEVVGTVVSTISDPLMEGCSLRLVQQVDLDGKHMSYYRVAVDSVGARDGDWVLIARGGSARMTDATKGRPADTCIMAIVDSVDIDSQNIYKRVNS